MSKRFVHNTLDVLPITNDALGRARHQLQQAALTGLRKVENEIPRMPFKDKGIYTGVMGIVVTFIRCAVQHKALGMSTEDVQALLHKAKALLDAAGPPNPSHIRSGRISPLDSSPGIAFVKILYSLYAPGGSADSQDLAALERAVHVAKEDDSETNEILYGRAGLLYALCELRSLLMRSGVQPDQRLVQLTSNTTLKALCDCIIRDGMDGTNDDDDEPLWFVWHGKQYLGTMHGTAGILTVLLQCPENIITPYKSRILTTVRHLASLISENDGHLPSSLPAHHDARRLVQICHGSPGYVLLITTLKSTHPDWAQELGQLVDDTLKQATNAVWERGLLTKGLGLCHGITGNAWPWLLLEHVSPSSADDADSVFGRALAFLLEATKAPPMSYSTIYDIADHPYSLFEGLAGAVCCWVEACAIISSRLGEDGGVVLGLPGIGGLKI